MSCNDGNGGDPQDGSKIIQAEVARLSKLGLLQYDLERSAAAQGLGIRASKRTKSLGFTRANPCGFQKMQAVVQKKQDQIVLELCYVSTGDQWAVDAAKARHPSA